jgi:hypothetical protein
MRWRSKPRRVAGEYPESFVKRWMAVTLPSTTPAQAASAVRHLRSTGWTEEQIAEFILPYMPPDVGPRAMAGAQGERVQAISLPSDVTTTWLDEHLPALDRRQLRLVVDELERRGWATGTVAMAVLPHLLPKLPAEDARAVVSGLADLGMTDEEIARATAPGSA